MPITWSISADVLSLTVKGCGNSELRKAISEAMCSREFPHNPAVLLDTRQETASPPTDHLRQGAGWIATALSRRAGSRCALVVGPRPNRYGLARMLAVFLEFNGINTEIFATIREARRWLTPADGWKTGAAAG